MSQDGPKMAPKWSKMVQDFVLGLSWAFIFGCLGRSLALPSFCPRFAVVLPLLCPRFAFALPSICFCIAVALPSLFLSVGGAPLNYKALLKRLQDLMYIDKPYLFRGISRSARTY